jgi:hypothetical protein
MKGSISAFFIALSVVIASSILGSAWKHSHQGKTAVNVTGMASRDFDSDLIVWDASFSRKSMTLKDAYTSLKQDAAKIKGYLTGIEHLNEADIVFSSVTINKEFITERMGPGESKQVFDGYNLSQNVHIESRDVAKIETVSRQITDLIDLGIELNSEAPRYYYTKLANLKIEMLAAAAKDARERAEKLVQNAGGSIGKLKGAEMGVFQITAPNSTEGYSWGGSLNTSSKKKTASITVKLELSLD